ncbi:MAG: hypothetical protein FWD14_08560 [Treponema sp.]|nr:hypothetical protein [Treponema sp.]
MKKITVLFLMILLALPLFAQEEAEITSSSEIFLLVSSLPEAKLGFTHGIKFPFLQGDNPLTEDNNILLSLTGEVSPISLNGIIDAIWTPIAFFEFNAGARIGSGWSVDLFGSEIYGIGLNKIDIDGKSKIDSNPFDGFVYKALVGAALQFDFAAIKPGDWNHIVMRTYHQINYMEYSRAKTNQPWFFEADDGENCNGFNYYTFNFIGYQMPIFLSLAGFAAEAELYLYDTPGRSKWGDDLLRWTFSSLFNFAVTEQFDISLITQFRTQRNFIESNWKNLHYQNRTINTSNSQRLEFYRVAAAFTYRF